MAVISFKCPNCDGELIFDPSSQKYKCEYCASLFSQEELDAMRPGQTKEAETNGQEPGTAEDGTAGQTEARDESGGAHDGEAVSYTCPSCGAQIVTDATTAAAFCYYCHNPVVLSGRLEGKYLPDKVIPFSITREAARKGFQEYISKKKFVPKAFFNKKQIESLTGVYFPYWHYHAVLDGKLQADARRLRVWRVGDMEYTETKHYSVSREGQAELDNLTENALKKANSKLAAGVMPYEFEKMQDFKLGYLSGFLAERRDIERQEVEGRMQGQMRSGAERLLRETITGYDSVSVRNSGFTPEKEDWSYVLFPVWTLTYKGKNGKIYYYSMNGQTGKVYGELPVDYGKAAAVSGILAVVVLILGLIGGYFL